jgi:hypothetical protein
VPVVSCIAAKKAAAKATPKKTPASLAVSVVNNGHRPRAACDQHQPAEQADSTNI